MVTFHSYVKLPQGRSNRFLLDFWMNLKMLIPDTHQMICLMEKMMLETGRFTCVLTFIFHDMYIYIYISIYIYILQIYNEICIFACVYIYISLYIYIYIYIYIFITLHLDISFPYFRHVCTVF